MAKKTLKQLTITRVALVPAGSNPHADVVLIKSAPVPPQSTTKEPVEMKKNIDLSKLSPEEQSVMTALLSKSATDLGAPDPSPVVEDAVIKALPPEAQALIKSAQDRADQAVRMAEEAQTLAAVEKSLREENAFVTATSPFVKAYPGELAKNASLLFRVKKAVSADDFTALETLIKAGNAALAVAGKELGSSESPETGDSMSSLRTIAKEIEKAEGVPYSQALEKAMQKHPELVQQSRAPRRKRRGGEDDED